MKTTETHVYFVNGYLSNWYGSNFKLSLAGRSKPIEFNNSEQAFMAFKALHFNDFKILDRILNSFDPEEQKLLGKEVRNFDKDEWLREAPWYMVRANVAKFMQNSNIKAKLLATERRVLVEAAWYDQIWGVGLRESDPLILDKANWKGLNFLGKSLILVREAAVLFDSETDMHECLTATRVNRMILEDIDSVPDPALDWRNDE